MNQADAIFLSWRTTEHGDNVVFNEEAQVLTEVPGVVLATAAAAVIEVTDYDQAAGVPEATLIISTDGDWEVRVHKWGEDDEVRVLLRRYDSDKTVKSWDIEETLLFKP